jgi:hypothetical protein
MKYFLLPGLFLFLANSSLSQSGNRIPDLDKSPMDMSYYPPNYPILKIQNKANGDAIARVIYSRPQRQGRKVFGELVEYGKVWRLGANEATEIEFFQTVRIGGKKIPRGRYTLYALVNETSWDIILNKDIDVWGAFKYDMEKDLVRVTVPVQKADSLADALYMYFEQTAEGIQLVIGWEQVVVLLPIKL